jgi:integrase
MTVFLALSLLVLLSLILTLVEGARINAIRMRTETAGNTAVRSVLGEFHRATDRAGLPRIRIHDLRHSHVALLINMGFSIEEISEKLGHESAAITWKTYAHLYPGKDRALAKKLEDVRRKSIKDLSTETPEQ